MQKKIPMRMCVGCREMKPKRSLVRIVCTKIPDGGNEIKVDLTGRAPGRGAYICTSRECLEKAKKTRALERAFSEKLEDDVFISLADAVSKAEQLRENEDQEG